MHNELIPFCMMVSRMQRARVQITLGHCCFSVAPLSDWNSWVGRESVKEVSDFSIFKQILNQLIQ